MSRSNSKHSIRDKQHPRRRDPNQPHLPLVEDFDALDYSIDDEMREVFAKLKCNFEEFSDGYTTVTIDAVNDRITFERMGEFAVINKFRSHAVTAAGFRRIYDRMRRTGFSVAQQFAQENDPPKRAEMLLHFGLPKRDRECMIGDLEEEYRTVILPKYGAGVAARWYWWQAVRSVAAASGGRVRVWLSFGGFARAAGWIVEKFTL